MQNMAQDPDLYNILYHALSLSRSFTSSPPDIDMISLRISAYSTHRLLHCLSSSITSISALIPLSNPHDLPQSHSPAPLDKGQISAWWSGGHLRGGVTHVLHIGIRKIGFICLPQQFP